MIDGVLLGVIVTASLTAGAFFLRFWLQTRDPLFLGFAASFFVEAGNRLTFAFVADMDGPHPVVYSIRLLSYLLILGAIAHKNWGRQPRHTDGDPQHD